LDRALLNRFAVLLLRKLLDRLRLPKGVLLLHGLLLLLEVHLLQQSFDLSFVFHLCALSLSPPLSPTLCSRPSSLLRAL